MRRRVASLLSLVLAVVASSACLVVPATAATATDGPSRPAGRPVTVLSFNIHHGVGLDGALDLDRVAAVIADSGADVVALQEVDRFFADRSDYRDQAADLGALLGMRHAYGANLDLEPAVPGGPRRQYGTAVLSRYPIIAARNTPLPSFGGEQRGLLAARLAVPGGPMTVYSTHLQHDNAAERAAQATAIADLIGAPDEPVVLAGDLNAEADAAGLAPLIETLTDSTVEGAAQDTFPAGAPTVRIDYVLAGDRATVLDSEVLATPASDHLPVRARIVPSRPYAAITSLDQAHAHNDYEHRRPLFDALHHGFTSVEADVWWQDGELRVAHDLVDTVPGRTLQSLYLDPLADIARTNRGRIFPDRGEPIQLLVDLKSAAEPTYAALDAALQRYRELVGPRGAVQVVVSGNRPRDLMAADRTRLAGYDGRLPDLGDRASADFMPLISDNWTRTFTWNGVGPMPAAQRAQLDRIVNEAHGADRRVRFWATPDQRGPARDALWSTLLDAGVDHINTDDLPGLRDALRACECSEVR